jgi:Rieske Fe-S protein
MSTQPESSAPEQTVRGRRTVLRGAAVIGLAGAAMPVLAACTDDGGDAGGGTTASAPQSSQPTTSASSSAPAGGAQAAGAALATTSEIPVGGGKVFGDAKVVVTQPTSGQFKGFSAVCTHQGCIVADVADGTINCACHGSKFKIADGSVANGPASRPLPTANITVQGGNIIGPAS